jgi:tetratricopeptide (TPR) repeat protein
VAGGSPAPALDHALRAYTLLRSAGHPWQYRLLNTVGWCYALLGDYEQTLVYCQQAISVLRHWPELSGQAHTWDSLGYAHHHLGHQAEAIACFERAIDLVRRIGDRFNEVTMLTHLGDAHHAAGDTAAADAWRKAVVLLDELDHPNGEQVRHRLAGLTIPMPTADPAAPTSGHACATP